MYKIECFETDRYMITVDEGRFIVDGDLGNFLIKEKNKLSRRNVEIADLKHRLKILGEGLNAIRDNFYDTKQNPQVFIGNVESILNAIKNKL